MNLDTAKKLNHFINQDFFMEALTSYINDRRYYLHTCLEAADTIEDVKYHQGALNELQRLSRIRTDVNAVTTLARK